MPSHPVWRFKAKGRLTFVGAARLHRGALQPPAFSSDPVTPQPANDPAPAAGATVPASPQRTAVVPSVWVSLVMGTGA